MRAKFDQSGDGASRLSVFVPDIGGPRALPSAVWPPSSTDDFGGMVRGGYVRRHLPHWSR